MFDQIRELWLYLKKMFKVRGIILSIKYGGTDIGDLTKRVEETLRINGYKLVEGGGTNAVYEKGNRTMRILFGAFVKYYKFMVQFQEVDSFIDLRITKHSSGVSGGLIGVSQVKKELTQPWRNNERYLRKNLLPINIFQARPVLSHFAQSGRLFFFCHSCSRFKIIRH